MSDDDYRDAAVIGKYYTRNWFLGPVRLIRQGDWRTGVQYANGRDDVGPDNKRHTVRVTGRYATRRNGIMIQYEMATPGGYFTNEQLQVKLSRGPRGPDRLYGPYESTLEDFHRGFEGPYDNYNDSRPRSPPPTSFNNPIDLRTPTKQSTPQQGDVEFAGKVTEEELDRRKLSSAKKKPNQIGGFFDLTSDDDNNNNNNNVKKRARVSSGSGSSSSGYDPRQSSEGGVDPNHYSQRGQSKRRLTSRNEKPATGVQYTRWISADTEGNPIISSNVLRRRHIRVGDIVWLYPPNSFPEYTFTGPYEVMRLSVVRTKEPYPNYVNARIQSLSDARNMHDVEADRLMFIIPSMTSDFMFRPIKLYYKWKTSWIPGMGYSNNIFIRRCDETEITVDIGDRVYIKREAGPNQRFRHNKEKMSMEPNSRMKIYEVAGIYYPYSTGSRNQALQRWYIPGMWPGGGVLVNIYDNRDEMDAENYRTAVYPIDDVIIGINPTRQQLDLYGLMRKQDGTVVKRNQELHKLSLKF